MKLIGFFQLTGTRIEGLKAVIGFCIIRQISFP